MKKNFERHKTSCKYKLDGFHYSFTSINYERELIYLDEDGINPIPVRLTDVCEVKEWDLGKLFKNKAGEFYWSNQTQGVIKWNF